MLRIGEFSRLSQTSVKTLRFYEAMSLFAPAHVDPDTAYRYYTADQIGELEQILHLRALGFSLRQIREVRRGDAEQLRAMLLDKRQELERRLRDERACLAGVDGWLDRLQQGEPSSHVVTLKRVGAQFVASMRRSVAAYADAVELFDELRRYSKEVRIGAGPPAAIWHTCGAVGRAIDCEAYVPVRRRVEGNPRIKVYEAPATMMACIVHRGALAASAGAYATTRVWIASHAFKICGPKRELYWRGGLDEDRASDITEIQFPIAIRAGSPQERR